MNKINGFGAYRGCVTLDENQPRKRQGLWVLVAGAACLAVGLALAAYAFTSGDEVTAAPPDAKKTLTVNGDMTLKLPDFMWDKNPLSCWGKGGYDDIREGAQVVVTDASGATVGIGRLATGQPSVSGDRATKCVFRWEVTGVPDGSSFYAVEVSHRGKLQYSRTEVVNPINLGF